MLRRKNITAAAKAAACTVLALGIHDAHSADVYPVFTDINGSGGIAFGSIDVFDDTGSIIWDETAAVGGNDILVATFNGPTDNLGVGITVAFSNGENGIDETECVGPGGACDGTGNVDVPNTEPVNAAVASVNAGGVISGKLNNGNIVRASVWMRSDPNDPATGVGSPGANSMPDVEGILKIELWKEALSTNGDTFGPGDSDFGDRIWDQDQQGADGSFADINADGISGDFSAPVTATLSTDSWTQLVVEYVVDDTPADAGNTSFPWDIGLDSFTVADVEDVRAVFFVGDFGFGGNVDFTGGGSWWMDNFLVEIFADQASADALDPTVSNPAPPEAAPGGPEFVSLQRTNPPGIGGWQSSFGVASSAAAIAAVPEPASALLLLVGCCCFPRRRRCS